MRTLLVFPSAREAASVKLRRAPFICGAGEAAGAAMAARLRVDRPGLVLLAGFCGALDPSLAAGSVILGRQVAMPGHDILDPDRFVMEEVRDTLHAQGFPFVFSRLLTLNHAAATPAEKLDLWNVHGAGGVDMESYEIAAACKAAGVRWLVVRSVIDSAHQQLPRALAEWRQPGDEGGALQDAVTRPQDWLRYAQLARHYPAAKRALGLAIPAVVRAAKNAKTVETLDLLVSAR